MTMARDKKLAALMQHCACVPAFISRVNWRARKALVRGQTCRRMAVIRSSTKRAGGQSANAKRVEAAVDLSKIYENATGRVHGYWQHKDKGFSAPGHLTGSADEAVEAAFLVDVALDAQKRTTAKLKGTHKRTRYDKVEAIEGSLTRKLSDNWSVTGGLRADDRQLKNGTSAGKDGEGHRIDLAGRVEYRPTVIEGVAPWMVYGFGQGTVSKKSARRNNHRGGAGGEVQVTENLKAKGEAVQWHGGFGALAGADYKVDEDTTIYLSYRLDTDFTSSDVIGRYGVLTAWRAHPL